MGGYLMKRGIGTEERLATGNQTNERTNGRPWTLQHSMGRLRDRGKGWDGMERAFVAGLVLEWTG